MARRVVITGSGLVTPFGTDPVEILGRIARGDSALRTIRSFDPSSCGESRGGEIDDFDARPFFRAPKALKLTDKRTRLAVAAASMALAAAGLSDSNEELDNTGVVIGSSGSDLQVEDLSRALGPDPAGVVDAGDIPIFADRILSRLNPLWLLVNLPNMVSAHVAIQLGLRGPSSTIMTDWIAGTQAIGEAFRWIAGGETDVVIAGGADAAVIPFVYASYGQEHLFAQPLGDGRSFVPADGAAMFVLEEREHATGRGATILAEIRGYASVSPHDDLRTTITESMRRALAQACWSGDDVRAVCSAPIFHPSFADAESDAIKAVIGADCRVMEFKSRLGHPLAASGCTDLALAMASADLRSDTVLTNAVGFSGQAATLAVELAGEAA